MSYSKLLLKLFKYIEPPCLLYDTDYEVMVQSNNTNNAPFKLLTLLEQPAQYCVARVNSR